MNHLTLLKEAIKKYPSCFPEDFSPHECLKKDVIIEEDGDFGLFEPEPDGTFYGHYFFLTNPSAKEGLRKGRNIITSMFEVYKARAIFGLTPLDNKAAIWMTRQLGFKILGEVRTEKGFCLLSSMINERN